MSPGFDRAPAARGLHLLQRAHDRWATSFEQYRDAHLPNQQVREDLALDMLGEAIGALTWARFLDDWCQGKDGRAALPGYLTARPDFAEVLNAARYVTNHGIHQLTAITVAYGVMRFPIDFDKGLFGWFGGVRWLPGEQLPPVDTERDNAQRRYRTDYERCFAANDIGPTLDQIRSWFEQHLRGAVDQ